MNIISFSIWGNFEFINGAFDNVKMAKELYPDWVCKFFCRNDVPPIVMNKLAELGALIEVVPPPYKGEWEGLFWRFLPASDPFVSYMISRDIDSLVNPREVAAVDEWMFSEKPFHSMRDNLYHTIVPILGGMWGTVGGYLTDMDKLIDEWNVFDHKGCDQEFLQQIIWPRVRKDAIVHDLFPDGVVTQGYSYHPRLWGGDIRPFPPHIEYDTVKFGKHVGARIE